MCINTNLILVCSIISLRKIWLYNHILQLLCFNSMYLCATTTTSPIYIPWRSPNCTSKIVSEHLYTMEEPKLHFWNCLRQDSLLMRAWVAKLPFNGSDDAYQPDELITLILILYIYIINVDTIFYFYWYFF